MATIESAAVPVAAPPVPALPLNLTSRQSAVLLHLLDGLTHTEAAARCRIHLRALEGLMHRARRKTGARTNLQLAAMFVRASVTQAQSQSQSQSHPSPKESRQ